MLIGLTSVTADHPADGSSEELPEPGSGWRDPAWERLLAELEDRTGAEEGWVTLDEASAATGVARSTLRSWYRSGTLPSRLIAGPHGPQRLVSLDAALERAVRSSRVRRQLERSRSLETEVEELRRRVAALESYLGFS
jgi:hypothetical protein